MYATITETTNNHPTPHFSFKWVKNMKEEIEQLKMQIAELRKEIKSLEDEVKPIDDKITALYEKTCAQRDQLSDKKIQLSKMQTKLHALESEHYIKTLKVGDTLWVMLGFSRGEYETITEEHAKKRLEIMRTSGDTKRKPHKIEVIERRVDGRFLAKEVGGKQKYIGFVRQTWNGPTIIWQKATD
jgi:DNA repair exonuclease SbcCD ATPase subunit